MSYEIPPDPLPRFKLGEAEFEVKTIKFRNKNEQAVLNKAKQVFSEDYFTRSQGIKELAKMMRKHHITVEDLEEGLARFDQDAYKRLTPSRVKEIRKHLKKDTLEKVQDGLTGVKNALGDAKDTIISKTRETVSQIPSEFEKVKGIVAPKITNAAAAVADKFSEAKDVVVPRVSEAVSTIQENLTGPKNVVLTKVRSIWSNLKDLVDQEKTIREQINKARSALGELRKVTGILKDELKKEVEAAKSHKIVQTILEKFTSKSKITPEEYALALVDLVRAKRLSHSEIHQLNRIMDRQLGNDPLKKIEVIRLFVRYLDHPDSIPKSLKARISTTLKDFFASSESKKSVKINEVRTSQLLVNLPITREFLSQFAKNLHDISEERQLGNDVSLQDLRNDINRMLKYPNLIEAKVIDKTEAIAEEPPAPPSRPGSGSKANAPPPIKTKPGDIIIGTPKIAPERSSSRKRKIEELSPPIAENPADRKTRHLESAMNELLKTEQKSGVILGYSLQRLDLMINRFPLDPKSRIYLAKVRKKYQELKSVQESFERQLASALREDSPHDRIAALLKVLNSDDVTEYNNLVEQIKMLSRQVKIDSKLNTLLNGIMSEVEKPSHADVFQEFEKMRLAQERVDNSVVFSKPIQRFTTILPLLMEIKKLLPPLDKSNQDLHEFLDLAHKRIKGLNDRADATQDYIEAFEASKSKFNPKKYGETLKDLIENRPLSEELLPEFLLRLDEKLGDRNKKEQVMRAFLESLVANISITPEDNARRIKLLANPVTKAILNEWEATIEAYRLNNSKTDLVDQFDLVQSYVKYELSRVNPQREIL